MYKLDKEKDGRGTIIEFLDCVTSVPGVGPASDMDGHDLSYLTRAEEKRRDKFIEQFNERYSAKAERRMFKGFFPYVTVEAFYGGDLDSGGWDSMETAKDEIKDWEKAKELMSKRWKSDFGMSQEAIDRHLDEYKRMHYEKGGK